MTAVTALAALEADTFHIGVQTPTGAQVIVRRVGAVFFDPQIQAIITSGGCAAAGCHGAPSSNGSGRSATCSR